MVVVQFRGRDIDIVVFGGLGSRFGVASRRYLVVSFGSPDSLLGGRLRLGGGAWSRWSLASRAVIVSLALLLSPWEREERRHLARAEVSLSNDAVPCVLNNFLGTQESSSSKSVWGPSITIRDRAPLPHLAGNRGRDSTVPKVLTSTLATDCG